MENEDSIKIPEEVRQAMQNDVPKTDTTTKSTKQVRVPDKMLFNKQMQFKKLSIQVKW